MCSIDDVSNSTVPSANSSSTTSNREQAKTQDTAPAQSQGPVAAEAKPEEPPAEPAMFGSAERMWVKMEMKPVKAETAKTSDDKTKTASTSSTKTSSTGRASTSTNAEIRQAWLWGSVSLHQEPAEGKTKGQDASGEAIYVDNVGEGKVISYVYQREPNEKTYLPGPLPPARVENDDKAIKAAGVNSDEPKNRPGLGRRARNARTADRKGFRRLARGRRRPARPRLLRLPGRAAPANGNPPHFDGLP